MVNVFSYLQGAALKYVPTIVNDVKLVFDPKELRWVILDHVYETLTDAHTRHLKDFLCLIALFSHIVQYSY